MRQPRRLAAPAIVAAGMLALAGCADAGYTATYVEDRPTLGAFGPGGAGGHGGGGSEAAAPTSVGSGQLVNAQGGEVGTVTITQSDGALDVTVDATGLQPGFHGLHVHTIGKCEPNSANPQDANQTGAFLSAGGHLAGQGPQHPDHAGDLPSLLVNPDGSAHLVVKTARLTPELLFDSDGAALVVHAGPDNFANIPARYAAGGADDQTRQAGDGGDRVACAVIEKTEAGDAPEGATDQGH